MPLAPAEYLAHRIPNAQLIDTLLPHTDNVRLWLLNHDYPQSELSPTQAEALMDDPPYWAFCWASGWVVAQWLFEYPDWVSNRSVVDFGCGSGVAGIAALKAGAKSVVFCDQDPIALNVTQSNIALNHPLSLRSSPPTWQACETLDMSNVSKHCKDQGVVIVSDVFYDRSNLPLLPKLLACYETVIVADSRLKNQALEGMHVIGKRSASTLPDLGESEAFKEVTLYCNHALNLG